MEKKIKLKDKLKYTFIGIGIGAFLSLALFLALGRSNSNSEEYFKNKIAELESEITKSRDDLILGSQARRIIKFTADSLINLVNISVKESNRINADWQDVIRKEINEISKETKENISQLMIRKYEKYSKDSAVTNTTKYRNKTN